MSKRPMRVFSVKKTSKASSVYKTPQRVLQYLEYLKGEFNVKKRVFFI